MSTTILTLIGLLLVTMVRPDHGQVNPTGVANQAANEKAQVLFQNALLHARTWEWELVRRQIQEATRIWIQQREPEKAAAALLQLGYSCWREQKYSVCLYFYGQALEIKPLPGAVRAAAYNAIAGVYAEVSNNDLAIHYFTRANEQARKAGDQPCQLQALAGIAEVYRRTGDKKRALAVVSQARRLKRHSDAVREEAALLYISGQLNQEEGRLAQAKSAFEQALTIYARKGDAEGQVKALCSIVEILLISSYKREALDRAMAALNLAMEQASSAKTNAEKTRVRDLLWRAWLSRARAEWAIGNLELASKSFSWAVSHAEGSWWLVRGLTESSAIAFRQETQALYRDFVDFLIEQGNIAEAFAFADSAKARAIRGITQARRRNSATGQSSQAEQPSDRHRSIARLRALLLSSKPGAERHKLQREIRDAEYALEEERFRSEVNSSRDRPVWSTQATVKWLQEMLSRDKSALVEFLLGERRSFAWLITENSFSCETLPGRGEIEQVVRSYLANLANAPNPLRLETEIAKTREQSEALFSILFGKLAARLSPDQIMIIIPDGLLHYLPFETLIRERRYLVEDYEISYNPSASMLGLWRDLGNQTNSGKKMELLAFGDPLLESVSANFSAGRVSNRALTMRSAQRDGLSPIPRTRDEIEYIAGLFPAELHRVYLDKRSTEDAFKRERLADYRRLHFATHSLIDEVSPARSGVLFTLDDDSEEDGLLEVAEISALNIDCDLVVLSACQTGRGKLFSGEGIVGLSRAFLRAGARSVVVSLWNVSDIGTSRLMKAFYRRLVDGVGNAKALRGAKLQMMKESGGLQHPHYWAPFVIIGKP